MGTVKNPEFTLHHRTINAKENNIMLKEKDLIDEVRNYRIQSNSDIELTVVKREIERVAEEAHVPMQVTYDEIKTGGIFSNTSEACIIVAHPQHFNDYQRLCIRMSKMGLTKSFRVLSTGFSKLHGKDAGADTASILCTTQGIGGLLAGAAIKKVFSANKVKMNEEDDWYACLFDILDTVFQ